MRRGSRLRGVLAACMMISVGVMIAASPVATGCDACEFVEDCAAKNGVSEESIRRGAANGEICGHDAKVQTTERTRR